MAALALTAALTLPSSADARTQARPFELAGCDRADGQLTITTSTRLDPDCTYAGVSIVASDVVLDCRGALISDASGERRRGIWIHAPADSDLSGVTVRNCHVEGFLNGVRVERDGFKELPGGREYERGFSDIVVERTSVRRTRGSGVFVNGYVTGVTLRKMDIRASGGVGVYLEAGSKGSVVEDSAIVGNGFGDVKPEGVPFQVGGQELRYLSTGREGIAIDGSRDNLVRRNLIAGNSAGGVFLYKNCGEYVSRPGHWVRRYGATDNRIVRNRLRDEQNGVWIGSRMAENQFFLDCSDPAYGSGPLLRLHLDYAARTTVRGNRFSGVQHGVRIEDDGARVVGNSFRGSGRQAVLLGTKERTAILGLPVRQAVIRRNRAAVTDGRPYQVIHPSLGTVFSANRSHGREVPLVTGSQPLINPFLFVVGVLPPASR